MILTHIDQNGDNLIFSISGGVDEDKFSLNSTTGSLNFLSAPDSFENPSDQGSNNVYDINISSGIADGKIYPSYSQSFSIRVTDISEQNPLEYFSVNAISSNGGHVLGWGDFQSGEIVTLNAVPQPGYLFFGWSGDLNSSEIFYL